MRKGVTMTLKTVMLPASEIPRQWYNILADIKMNPPLGPDGNPVKPDDLAPVFPMNLIEQEVSPDGGSISPTRFWMSSPSGGPRR
jgi:predicted alternative tryptophan synthase beta-subunit